MDGGFRGDITEILRQIERADVITIFFPLLRKSLLIDTRYDLDNDPLVRIVPVARSPADRQRRLQRVRPQFPRPNNVAMFQWTH